MMSLQNTHSSLCIDVCNVNRNKELTLALQTNEEGKVYIRSSNRYIINKSDRN